MAKKKQIQSTAPVLTRGQITRREREQQQIRNFSTAIIVAVSAAALILLFAALSTFVLKPNEEVASVNGVKITRAQYDKLRRWNAYQADRIQAAQQQAGQTGASATGSTGTLQAVANETSLDATTVNQLVDSEALRQASKSDPAVNISASEADLKAEALKDFVPPPVEPTATASSATATAPVSGTTAITPTVTATFTAGPPTQTPTSTPTLAPVPGSSATAVADYDRVIKAFSGSTAPKAGDAVCDQGCPNISEGDYLHLVIEPRYLQTKVTDLLAAKVATETEQIHAQHILTATEEGAKAIIAMLDKGADFTKLANEQSSEQNDPSRTAPKNGGDLGWFPQVGSGLVDEFVAGAWPVAAGTYTKTPVKTTFGYHVIKVIARDPHRPLSETQISDAKTKAYNDWFTNAKSKMTITTKLPPASQPTQPAIVPPTSAPAQEQPTSAATPPAQPTAAATQKP